MKVLKFGGAVINTDGTITVTATLGAENSIEATFLGFVAATIEQAGAGNSDPIGTILAEARALNIGIPT